MSAVLKGLLVLKLPYDLHFRFFRTFKLESFK